MSGGSPDRLAIKPVRRPTIAFPFHMGSWRPKGRDHYGSVVDRLAIFPFVPGQSAPKAHNLLGEHRMAQPMAGSPKGGGKTGKTPVNMPATEPVAQPQQASKLYNGVLYIIGLLQARAKLATDAVRDFQSEVRLTHPDGRTLTFAEYFTLPQDMRDKCAVATCGRFDVLTAKQRDGYMGKAESLGIDPASRFVWCRTNWRPAPWPTAGGTVKKHSIAEVWAEAVSGGRIEGIARDTDPLLAWKDIFHAEEQKGSDAELLRQRPVRAGYVAAVAQDDRDNKARQPARARRGSGLGTVDIDSELAA